jgi:hypothetical protein
MKKHFFIYSLPRSGSAWLSLFFSQPGSFCYHEPLADAGDIFERMAVRSEPCVGGIDTSAYLNTLKIPENVKVYYLWRDWRDIQQSSLRMGFDIDVETEQKRFFANLPSLHPKITIKYKDLDSLDYLELLWTEIVGEGFDRERAEYLVEMKVERSLESVMKRERQWRAR